MVQNCTLEPVSEDQFLSRNLLKAFTFAAAKAQSIYGVNEWPFWSINFLNSTDIPINAIKCESFQADVRDLPQPITVQCVQVHVNRFHFGVYQLNTLNLDGDSGIKNYWFNVPPIHLYTNCEYEESRPKLKNYNNDVLRHTLAFYQNQWTLKISECNVIKTNPFVV